ncbi:MAG: MarR family transcriptional regulator [Pseudomonadota bacterium]
MDGQDDPTGIYFALFNEIGIIDQLATTRFERVLPHDLTVAQFGVLNHFARLGGERSPARLAAAFQVTKAAMTNIVGKLEGKGFLAVRPDPEDGRGKLVSLTGQGRAAREDAIAASGPAFADVLAALSRQDVETVLPILQKLRVWLDEAR